MKLNNQNNLHKESAMNNKFNIWQERVIGKIEKTFHCTRSDAEDMIKAKNKTNPNWLFEKFMIGTSALGIINEFRTHEELEDAS